MRRIRAVAVALLVLGTLGGAVAAAAVTLPATLSAGEGLDWVVLRDGTLGNGLLGAESGPILIVNGRTFPAFSTADTASAGREFVIGPATLAGLEVERHVFIPEDDSYAQFADVLRNPYGVPLVVTATVRLVFAGDRSPGGIQTSDGGASLDTGDSWVVARGAANGGDAPAAGYVFATPLPTEARLEGRELQCSYRLTIPAGGELTLTHFIVRERDLEATADAARRVAILSRHAAPGRGAAVESLVGMSFIPAGEFEMGDAFHEGCPDEWPVHTVFVSDYYIGRCEVTNDEMVEVLQWAYDHGRIDVTASTLRNATGDSRLLLFIGESECRIAWNGRTFDLKDAKASGYPCVEVTWYGAAAYCNYRSEMEGLTPCYDLSDWSCDWTANGYRLPTEAEWEKAARGGAAGHRFAWDDVDTIDHTRANYESRWRFDYDASDTRGHHPVYGVGEYPYTCPVGSFEPNGYGLYNVAGNVWEWVWDRYDGHYYMVSPSVDPRGPDTGDYRVLRSGRWGYDADNARVSGRRHGWPGGRRRMGFRVVLPVASP